MTVFGLIVLILIIWFIVARQEANSLDGYDPYKKQDDGAEERRIEYEKKQNIEDVKTNKRMLLEVMIYLGIKIVYEDPKQIDGCYRVVKIKKGGKANDLYSSMETKR